VIAGSIAIMKNAIAEIQEGISEKEINAAIETMKKIQTNINCSKDCK